MSEESDKVPVLVIVLTLVAGGIWLFLHGLAYESLIQTFLGSISFAGGIGLWIRVLGGKSI